LNSLFDERARVQLKEKLDEVVDMADSFRQKSPSNLALIVQINIQPTDRVWHIGIDPGKSIQVRAGSHPKAQFIFSTTEETLRLIYEGK
jgi:hypothetical protein